MRKIIEWFSRFRTNQHVVAQRPRIDLGDRRPRCPIYAIGDVHGRLDLLKNAEVRIADDISATGKDGLTVLLGDFIDRGPSSAQVINHLMRESELGLKRLSLAGNHEEIFLRYLNNPEKHASWLGLGGEQTLASYGIDVHSVAFRQSRLKGTLRALLDEAVPESHRRFLADLPVSLKVGNFLLVHAGVRPGVSLGDQSDQDMIWIREPFLSEGPKIPTLFVIHGHTPYDKPNPGPQRMGIDTGAFYTGRLTVLRVDGNQSRFV